MVGSRRSAVRRISSVTAVLVAFFLLASGLIAAPAHAAPRMQLTLTQTTPNPQPTAGWHGFTLQAQCSDTVGGAPCLSGVIRIADPTPGIADTLRLEAGSVGSLIDTTGWILIDGPVPYYTLSPDPVTGGYVIPLVAEVPAGSSFDLKMLLSVPSHTTPDQTASTITATLSGANFEAVTASVTATWSAQANLAVGKRLEFGDVNADALLDKPVTYYLYPCNDSGTSLGQLELTLFTMVDQLPAGVTFVSATEGGSYDQATHTVSWTKAPYRPTTNCSMAQVSPFAVTVIFPSNVYGEKSDPLQLTATNTVNVTGIPLAQTTPVTDSATVTHGFTEPNPGGGSTKIASTPYFNATQGYKYTYADREVSFRVNVMTVASSTSPYYFRLSDPLPCLDVHPTPSETTQYTSPTDPATPNGGTNQSLISSDSPKTFSMANVPGCLNPAFLPDDNIEIKIDTASTSITPAGADQWIIDHPTITIELWSTAPDGTTSPVSIDVPFLAKDGAYLRYRVSWDAIVAALPAGNVLSGVVWDSRSIDLQQTPYPTNDHTAAEIFLNGTVAPNTAEYPILEQYRVRNRSHWEVFNSLTAPSNYIGNVQADVIILRDGPILVPDKYITSGTVTLSWDEIGSGLQPNEQVVVTDLLPLGYKFVERTSTSYVLTSPSKAGPWSHSPPSIIPGVGGIRNNTGFTELDGLDIFDYVTVEVIDDYNGTGRQLVRFTMQAPPVEGGWDNLTGLASVSFKITPYPYPYTTENTVQVFPTESESLVRCSPGTLLNGLPDIRPALTADPNDLDADGKLNGNLDGEAYCQDSYQMRSTSTVLDIASRKYVQGDLDPDYVPNPGVGMITTEGGTASFRIDMGNIGSVGLKDWVVYDVLPYVGDTGITENQINAARGSEFDVVFDAITSIPAGIDVWYSASSNPCRTELATTVTLPALWPAGCVNDWTLAPRDPITGELLDPTTVVKSLKFTPQASGTYTVLDPGENLSITYDVTYPPGVEPGQIAWNVFAYAGKRANDNLTILPAQPPKVGIAVPKVDLELTKGVAPPKVFVDEAVQYTIDIKHAGVVAPETALNADFGSAYNVVAHDNAVDKGLTIVEGSWKIVKIVNGVTVTDPVPPEEATFDPATGDIWIKVLNPLETYRLTYRASYDRVGIVENFAQIMVAPNADTPDAPNVSDVDSEPGNNTTEVPAEDDEDNAVAEWVIPTIDLQKQVETEAGSGLFIEADDTDNLMGEYEAFKPINYRLIITNTGNVDLENVQLTDDTLNELAPGTVCDQTIGNLAVGESVTIPCTWTPGFGVGITRNTASVTGEATLEGVTKTVSDEDPATVVVVPVMRDLVIDKQDPNCSIDRECPLDGAEFTLFRLADGELPVEVTPGVYSVGLGLGYAADDLLLGDYVLYETKAPMGRELLAEPIAFTLGADGITITSGGGTEIYVDEASQFTIVVANVSTGVLPHTGGDGVASLFALGMLMVGGGALWMRRRRT